MKKIFLPLLTLALCLAACKKDPVSAPPPNSTGTPSVASNLNPVLQAEAGSSYSYETGSDPLTVLAGGDVIISSLRYDGSNYDQLQLTRLSPSGVVVWNTIINKGHKYKSGSSFVSASGELISVATAVSPLSWTSGKVLVTKLNLATGDTVWTRIYGHNYIDIGMVGHEDAAGNYEIVDFSSQNARVSILRVASNGDSLGVISDQQSPSERYKHAIISSGHAIILAGESGTQVNSKEPVYICKYSNGLKQFENRIPLDNYDNIIVNGVCEASDGGFVVYGECFNAANTSLRYGFLLKVDASGNKVWERIITQVSTRGVSSCVEKAPDVFYLCIYRNPDSNIYTYDLTTLTMQSTSLYTDGTDVQLLIRAGKLYRALLGTNTGSYEVVKLRVYSM